MTTEAQDVVLETALKQDISTESVAKVKGELYGQLPADLYIPPDAMEVILEVFEGPLDLLLYLIKKHNLDILNIPVSDVTRQYMEYIELMTVLQIGLAADYLEMAALLTEIKSRMLLPKPESLIEEEDPRAELVRRLQEYERFKKAAENMEVMPRFGREWFTATASTSDVERIKHYPEVELKEILLAFKDVLKRVDSQTAHTIKREALSVRERMSRVLEKISNGEFIDFVAFFDITEGRLGVVVTFLAVLELLKESLIELVQTENYGPIYVRIHA